MSTKEKTGSSGRTAGILFILLALAAVAVLGVYIYRQLQPPKAPETAIGYVASETASAPVYDAWSTARGTSCWTRPIWPMISAGRYRWRRCTPCGA